MNPRGNGFVNRVRFSRLGDRSIDGVIDRNEDRIDNRWVLVIQVQHDRAIVISASVKGVVSNMAHAAFSDLAGLDREPLVNSFLVLNKEHQQERLELLMERARNGLEHYRRGTMTALPLRALTRTRR